MQDLRVSLVQSELYWEETEANLAMFEEKIWKVQKQTDIIILPEMFNSGFTMNVAKVAEPMNSKTFRWMKQMADQTNAVITGSAIIKEGGNYYNRLLWMEPDGKWDHYDKRHLFRMSGEDLHYSVGTKRIIKSWKGWNICPLICYDLRFPVWSRRVANDFDYDLLIYIANWPVQRISAWNTLLKARAIENLSYVAGVNRIGTDENQLEYPGESAVIGPKGELLMFHGDFPYVETVVLSKKELEDFRFKFPAHLDADAFTIL